ncbi:hypothetical protein C8R46DRAFT_284465 [Mycena filopes]|nr:hypothetical protein C8R46DRAFT_284465 [Mycena filopes]
MPTQRSLRLPAAPLQYLLPMDICTYHGSTELRLWRRGRGSWLLLVSRGYNTSWTCRHPFLPGRWLSMVTAGSQGPASAGGVLSSVPFSRSLETGRPNRDETAVLLPGRFCSTPNRLRLLRVESFPAGKSRLARPQIMAPRHPASTHTKASPYQSTSLVVPNLPQPPAKHPPIRLVCGNCHSTTTCKKWKESVLTPGWTVCTRCGSYEKIHKQHRPLKTRGKSLPDPRGPRCLSENTYPKHWCHSLYARSSASTTASR